MFDDFSATFEIKKYFPSSPKGIPEGIILVCSADNRSGRCIDAQESCTISVAKMEKTFLAKLFWAVTKRDVNYSPSDENVKDALRQLIEKVDCHTLSVWLAANFLKDAKGTLPTAQELYSYIAAVDQEQVDYSSEINESLWKSWQVIIAKLRAGVGEDFEDAIEYLRLRAFYSHHHLPTKMLFGNVIEQRKESHWIEHDHIPAFLDHRGRTTERYEKAERRLAQYGLVTVEDIQGERGTTMVKVLHLCAQRLLWDQDQDYHQDRRFDSRRAALCTLGESIKWTFQEEDVTFRKKLIPHIDACLKLDKQSPTQALNAIETRTAGNILLNLAAAYTESGRFDTAGELQRRALERLETDLGPEDDLTLKANGELASNLEIYDKFDNALKKREDVLKARKARYDRNKTDRAEERKYDIAAATAAISYARDPQRRQEALELRETVLKHAEQVEDQKDPFPLSLLKAKRELAISYIEVDRRQEALQLREEVVRALEEKGKGKQVFALNSRLELLTSLSNARQFDRAERLGNSIVKDSEASLGLDHPDTWLARSKLATLKTLRTKDEEAMKELKEAVTKFSDIWGESHSITAHARVSLAKAHLKLGDYQEAVNLFHKTSDIYETQYGSKSEKKLMHDFEMVRILQAQGKSTAVGNARSIISSLEEICPANDTSLISARLHLCKCLVQFGEIKEAALEYEGLSDILKDDAHQTTSSFKAKLRLASIYVKLAAPSEVGSDFEALTAGLSGPAISGKETSSASERFSKRDVLKAIWKRGVRKLKPKASVETIRLEEDDIPIYKDWSRSQLKGMALDLRSEVVSAIVEKSESGYIARDQLAAQACYELAQSYDQIYQYENAISLEKAVVIFYNENFGPDHSETMKHKSMVESWKRLVEDSGASQI
jgi:tetratricopeptide (TPR) repeat protein